MCGGAPPKLQFGLEQWIYSLPYLFILIPFVEPVIFILCYLTAVIGKRTGHGGGMDLGHSNEEAGNGRTPEKVEFLILPLYNKIPRYWYDALLLALTGLIVTIPTGIVIADINPFWGVFLALSGLTKPIAYMIGWVTYPNFTGKGLKWLNEATAIGEFLTGFFSYICLGIAAIALMMVGL